MADRRVTRTRKNQGDITALCGNGNWSPVAKADAIQDIERGTHSYHVNEAGHRSNVVVKGLGNAKYLTTEADATSKNNLDNLPPC